MNTSFFTAPPPMRADRAIDDRDAFASAGDAAAAFAASPAAAATLDAAFADAPFLADALRWTAPDADWLSAGPDAALDAQLDACAAAAQGETVDDAATMRALRLARRRAALTIALADLGGAWTIARCAAALTRFADAAIQAALEAALAKAESRGRLRFDADAPRGAQSGLTVLGMGKLGAGELNYSSDVDLILVYDPDRAPLTDPDDARRVFTQIAQDIATLLERRTVDGYVLRVDYRLRPDPGSTPPAISRDAAETYYAAHGQNWERAAFIKARPVAGDGALGAELLHDLRPFVWRRTLDFAALQDVLSLKRQRAGRMADDVQIAGGDVKFGRGGIRDVEFYAQTQQLIWGGRNADLRARRTDAALAALADFERCAAADADGLTARYWRLRAIEQRLQMRDDRQTYRLPEDDAALEAFARFAGYADRAALEAGLGEDMRWVADTTDRLFPEAPTLSSATAGGPLAFAGEDEDPATEATLAALGFGDPPLVVKRIRDWHRGKPRATRSERARQSLTELTPPLLDALAATADPSGAFARFDAFLVAQPAGVQLFDLLQRHPDLLRFLAKVMGDAPQMAETLAARPALLDAVLEPGFDGPAPRGPAAAAALDAALKDARGYEERLDIARRWAAERGFQAAMRLLSGACDADEAAAGLSDVAEATIDRLKRESEDAFAERHGRPPAAGAVIVALGKLGGRSLAFGSDLDLIYLYDAPYGPTTESDGERPLAPGVWFNRAAQRLIAALSAKTAEGVAYEVDFRLRPHGTQGPTATSLDGFVRYHERDAWTWEAMALTRARVIAGPPDLMAKTDAAIRAILTRRRDPDALRRDVADMRARVAAATPTQSVWSFKHGRGGLMDVEFVLQHAQLRAAHDHPEALATQTDVAAQTLARIGALPVEDAETLRAAARLWRRAQAILRLGLADGAPALETPDLAGAPPGLRRLVARALDAPDFQDACKKAQATATKVHAIFRREIGDETTA